MTTPYFCVPCPVPAVYQPDHEPPAETADPQITALTRAILEVALAGRPCSQLDGVVHATVIMKLRQVRQVARQLSLISCHVQHPVPQAAEVALHALADGVHLVWVFRCEKTGETWQCVHASPVLARRAKARMRQRLRP